MKRIFRSIAAGVVLAGTGACFAQAGFVAAAAPQNVVQLSASGVVEVQQDWLTMVLSTSKEAADAATAQAQLKQALDAALEQARAGAQPGAMEVRTGAFGLYPRYGKDGRITGWQGRAELVLEGRDVARITMAAGRIPTLVASQVGFSLSREARAKVESEAQSQAIAQFRARASELTRSFGFADYSLREVSVGSNDVQPVPRMRSLAMEARPVAAADAPVPVEAGKAQVVVNVSGSVQMR